MTQRELAKRAGVSQSVIAAYERGTREPSLATLAALVEATGISLTVDLGPGISDVRVFGSVPRGEEEPTSDLDLLVHLPKGAGLFLRGRFKEDLEALLHVEVDVVPDDGVNPRVRDNIDADLVAL